jgi:glycosyltransferase involved in cell wall biosynthesis
MGMKLLLVHNHYQQRGGEDVVFEAEARLLEEHGHHVLRYQARNEGLEDVAGWTLARRTVWNGRTHRELRSLLGRERPAVVHVHNTLPVISPAVYYAARGAGVPVVQTLHNYRLLCPSAVLFRAGGVCEACLHRSIALPGVRHGCYRGSRAASGAVAAMLAAHRLIGTWRHAVDLYIALTNFARAKFIEGGLPAERIVVKPNFTRDPGVEATGGDYALFVGRLSAEKGVKPLLEAWQQLGGRVRLRVIGDGPEAHLVSNAVTAGLPVDFLGRREPDVVAAAMAGARFLVFPSVWYETFGLAIIEAFAVGLPVLASDLGAMSDLVQHRTTGLRFRPGDARHLVEQVEWALAHPEEMREMGRNARREYEKRYTPEANYGLLMDAYQTAMRRRLRPATVATAPPTQGGDTAVAAAGQGGGQPPMEW